MKDDQIFQRQNDEVLIVDDNPTNLKFLADILCFDGYPVRSAIDGKQAIQSITEKLPAIILLDVMMPEMDGFEVCRRLKSDRNTSNIPVIFISAMDDEQSKLQGFQVGGVDYITKPFRKEEVLARVKTHIGLAQMRLQLEKQAIDLQNTNNQLQIEAAKRKLAEDAMGKRILALTQPLDNGNEIDFSSLFNLPEIQKLQDQFAKAFGVASLITRPDGTSITNPSNFSYLCQHIIRCTEKGLKNCMQSDSVIGRHNPQGPIVQPCLSGGLWDAGASITVGGRHVANWMIGQVRNEAQNEDRLKEYALEIGADEGEFMKAFNQIPSMSQEQFYKIAEVLFTLAGQLSEMAYQNVQQARFINERIQAEEALLESGELFRTTLYSIGDGVITTDAVGRIQLMNPIAEQLTGWTQREASGQTLEKVFRVINEETRSGVEIAVRKVLREGNIVGLANHTVLISKDGTERPIADSGAPIRNEKGEIIGVVLVFRDQTDERLAHKVLRENEEKFRNLFENAAVGISMTGLDGSIKTNKTFSEMLGYSEEEFKNKNWREITHPDDIQVGLDVSDILLRGQQETVRYEKRYLHKNGSLIWADVSTNLHRDVNDNPNYFITSINDITDRKKAEEALLDADRKLNVFFDQSLDGFFFMMLDEPIEWNEQADKEKLLDYAFSHQRITRINDAMLDQYGFNRDQFIGLTPNDFFRHDIESGRSKWRLLFDSGKLHTETDARKMNGDQVFIEGDYVCIYDSEGRITGHFGIQRDITQSKLAIDAIQNERKLLRTLIDNLPVTIYVKDQETRKIVANALDLEVMGFSDEADVLGKTDLELFGKEIGQRGYADDLKVIRTGQAVINREEVFQDKNGFPRWLLTSKIPLLNHQGQPSGLVGIGRDITEKKKAEIQIQKLTKSIEQSPSTIIITDIQGNIEYVNPIFSEITGYTKEEVIGKNPSILKSGSMPAEVYSQLWRAIKAGDVWRGEFLNRKKNGELYWEWATLTSIKNEDGEITNYIAIKEDISLRKQMEADLIVAKNKAEESDRLKSAFLANMSHEIRTPLNSIIGFSELLSDSDFEIDEKKEFIEHIITNGNSLLNIISDIMDISRMESGQVTIRTSRIPVNKFIEGIRELFAKKFETVKLEFKLEIPESATEISILADVDRLRQIFNNLISNALKFTTEGFIQIGYQIKGDVVEFCVTDTGIGIPPDYHDKIFDRFRQVESSNTRKYGGNGLGLAITKNLVELMGGKIWMYSEYGEGASFFFVLPLFTGN